MNYSIITEKLCKHFKGKEAIKSLDLSVEEASIIGVVGQKGSGKSTLLQLLAGLSDPSSGEISYETIKKPKIGTFFCESGLFGAMTVRQNLTMKLMLDKAYSKENLYRLIEALNLSGFVDKKVKSMPSGARKRLGIGLAFSGDPEIVILDEPFKNLMAVEVKSVKDLILELNQKKHTTVLISGESVNELSTLTSKIFILQNGFLVQETSVENVPDQEPVFDQFDSKFIYIKATPIPEVKKVLDELEIFSYQTKYGNVIHVLEMPERKDEILAKLEERGVLVEECKYMYDFSSDKGGNR